MHSIARVYGHMSKPTEVCAVSLVLRQQQQIEDSIKAAFVAYLVATAIDL